METDFGDSISVLEEFEGLYMKCHNRWERMKIQTNAKRVLNEAAYVIFINFAIEWLSAKDSKHEISQQE